MEAWSQAQALSNSAVSSNPFELVYQADGWYFYNWAEEELSIWLDVDGQLTFHTDTRLIQSRYRLRFVLSGDGERYIVTKDVIKEVGDD